MMHVCHVCDSTFEGDYFRNLVTGLTELGVRISLVTLGTAERPTWLQNTDGVKYIQLGAKNKLAYLRSAFTLATFIKEEAVDILQTHLYFSGLVGALTKKRQRKALVVLTRHHESIVRDIGTRAHVAADRWMAENADRALTVSQAAKKYMENEDRIRRNDIEVIYYGFDFEKFSPSASYRAKIRREFGFAESDFVVGYVANLLPRKGHLQLLVAFKEIFSAIPQAKLVLAGRGSRSDISEAAKRFPNGVIKLAGWRPDVSAVMNSIDLFINPSLSESFSQVLIEGMAVGAPVITTRVGIADELIETGVNGILVEPDDPASIAEQTIALYRDPNHRREMAAAGRELVTREFTVERMVNRHFELYEKWLAEKGV